MVNIGQLCEEAELQPDIVAAIIRAAPKSTVKNAMRFIIVMLVYTIGRTEDYNGMYCYYENIFDLQHTIALYVKSI